MSWVIVAIVTTAVASTSVSARGQYVAGKIQKQEMKRQAEQEKLAAQSQELQRRQDLNQALAANIVGFGQMGIAGEGTPASIALEGAKQASTSESALGLSAKLRQAQLIRQGKNAKTMGAYGAASTILQGASQLASLVASPSGGGGGGGE
tara:strand:+ start:575 stop:1024 length:450 start_codon:yes stop_codon:yes gene_type:complete